MRLNPQTHAITVVTANRIRLFQRAANADLMLTTLFRYREQRRFHLHALVIMPDHLHALITPAESISKAVQLIKGGFSFAVRDQFKGEVWQNGYHDHRVVDSVDYLAQRNYIAENPSRKNYQEYPYVHTRFPESLDPSPTFS